MARDHHAEVQREYFENADVEHFQWTTGGPGLAETEDELLAPLLPLLESPCLEVGCGEGNNLVRLTRHVDCVGVDLFPKKLAFASQALPEVRLVTAAAEDLPFADGSFKSVFVRDLLHHVTKPGRVLESVMRTLAPGGRFCLLEPNGRNPIVRLQTHLVAAEAGARSSNPASIEALLRELPLRDVEVCTRQPLPLRRALLHYRYGFPSLGRRRSPRQALAALEGGLGRLLPASRWSYVQATARRDEN